MIKNPFSLSDNQLRILLKEYSSWSSNNPEGNYIQGLIDVSQQIKDTFLNPKYLNSINDEQLIAELKAYINKLEGPVGIKLGDKRLTDNLKELRKNFEYIISTKDNPFQVAYSLLEGDKQLKNFSKAFWSPILQARFPDEIPNWNNKTERFFKKLGVNISTSKLNAKQKIEKISNGFKCLHQLDPKQDFFQINHLMHYGTEIDEGKELLAELLTGGKPEIPYCKVYDIKKGAPVQNYPRLIDRSKNYFFWNSAKFKNNKEGDYVFVVNKPGKEMLVTKYNEGEIETTYDKNTDETSFTYDGKTYSCEGEWEEFTCFEIIDEAAIPPDWKWQKQIGQSETYDIWKENIDKISDRINKIDDLLEVFQDGDSKTILEYYKTLLNGSNPPVPKPKEPKMKLPGIWFVCQGSSFNKDQGQKYLFAPAGNEKGHTRKFWTRINEIKKGDIIFNYYKGIQGLSIAKTNAHKGQNPHPSADWDINGNYVDIEYYELNHPISKEELHDYYPQFKEYLKQLKGPFDSNGYVNQGYLFEFNYDSARLVREIYGEPFPSEIEELFDVKTILPILKTEKKATEIIQHIFKYIKGQGFNYDIKEIANFYLSLKTKPFVILAGISGTGKTKLVELFASSIGYGDNEHCIIIPVKPDWTDNSDLLGYTNLNKEFEKKKLTEVILAARENPNEPYFVVLDEMNLARVEHYFSDFLSIIETRKIDGKIFSTKPLLTGNDVGENTNESGKLIGLQIPKNLFVIGTVNMDETTFPFSKKVLDRANSIEMNQVKLDFIEEPESIEPLQEIYSDFLISDKVSSKHLSADEISLLNKNGFISELIKINEIQTNADLQFAYRVRDEIAFYLLNSIEVKDILSWEEAFDYQVMQKILPRIQGSALSINHLLINLINHFMGKDKFETKMHYEEDIKNELQTYLTTNPKYTRTLKKLDFMLRKYSQDGFTSFWI